MARLEGGTSAFRVDKEWCPQLIQALASKYRYKKLKSGELDLKPEKTHPWSDIADALQYAALGASNSIMARALRIQPSEDAMEAYREPSVASWT
jgi:hypothetical protein